jgi:hypothetical protein
MTSDSDLTRALGSWLHEDAHEDPSAVLDRVGAAVPRTPQAGRWLLPVLRQVGRGSQVAVGLVVAIALAAGAFGLLPRMLPAPGASPSASGSPVNQSAGPASPGPTASPVAGPNSVSGVATDQPCTRPLTVGSLLEPIVPIAVHHEDLERMVLSEADVAGLDGLDQDVVLQGYHDNAELPSVEVSPDTTCADIERLGRIEGYGNAYTSPAGDRSVLFSVHLFWTPEEAHTWVDSFVAGLKKAADGSGGTITFREIPDGLSIPDAKLYEYRGPDGTRTWAIFERTPASTGSFSSVVGWVVDLHPDGEGTIDVPAAAAAMAARVEAVGGEVAARPRRGLDAMQLVAAPLPMVEYGDLAAGFEWNSFLGGCQDTAERGFVVGPKAVADAQRFGRLTGCTAMYTPPSPGGDVVRVFSFVHVYRDATGASGALAENVADQQSAGGVGFVVPLIGEESLGIASPGAGLTIPADTRVVFRVGELLAVVAIQGPAATGREAYVIDLAQRLEERIRALISAG